MSLRIDDDRLRRKLEEKELDGQYGANPVQGPQGQQGNPQNGGVTETGLPVSVVEDAKKTNVFSAAQRAQNTEGAGAASVGAPQPQDPGLSTQFDGVPNQPTGDITVQPPNTSGQQLLSSSLRGAESNDGPDPQGGQKQQRYQASQDVNLTSIAYSGNGESTAPTPSGLDARLGITAPASGEVDAAGGSDGTGGATLTAGNEAADGTKNTGEATLATDTQPETGDTTNQNGADGVNGENGTNGTNGENGNVNGSGNEDNENDSANGNENGSEKPVETAEDEAKRLAEQQQQEQLRQQEQQRKEEEQQKQLAA